MAMSETWDVIVVGGGAAGFYGAIACAEHASRPLKIAILERSRRVLQKVRISGGGRCNVTHDTADAKWLATHYPRGSKPLIGPFHRYGPPDVIRWFEGRGVELQTEEDGRMFPVTDDSQTVIDALTAATEELGIEVLTRAGVEAVVNRSEPDAPLFDVIGEDGTHRWTRQILLATGGIRSGPGAAIAKSLGHEVLSPVPSLFTFEIDDRRLAGLQGISVDDVNLRAIGADLASDGPLLITHRGLSGPAVLKLSAWGARALHDVDYTFEVELDWLPQVDADAEIQRLTGDSTWGRRQIATRSPFEALPRRLWQRLVDAAGIADDATWAECSRERRRRLTDAVHRMVFSVTGQSVNKDEFVTCGGVSTEDVDMRTMESRSCPGLFFAGELLNIDGVTGGFNFQSAWTTGYLAGITIASNAATD